MKASNKYLCSCLLCKTEVFSCGLKAHYDSAQCKAGTTFVKNWKQKTQRDLKCIHCEFIGKNQNAIAQHEIRCAHNPSKIDLSYINSGQNFDAYREKVRAGEIKHLNKFSKAKSLGLSNPGISEDTRRKLSANTKIQNEIRWSDPKNIEAQRQKMRKVVEEHPESYVVGNRGRVKQIVYDGQKFMGRWEVDFYIWCKENNVICERNTIGFHYVWNGDRKYFPDFFLPDYDTYVEVKGYKTERDDKKWEYFPHKLKVILKKDIMAIRKNQFSLT
jgi:hypothetical protein